MLLSLKNLKGIHLFKISRTGYTFLAELDQCSWQSELVTKMMPRHEKFFFSPH